MTTPELLHRVAEQANRFRWRFGRPDWRDFEISSGTVRANPNLVAALSSPIDQPALSLLKREVGSIREGRITLLGAEWPLDLAGSLNPNLWLLDPVKGSHWPGKDTYCFDVDYRHAAQHSDVKFVWELNRLQMLHPVAVLARVTGDAGDVRWMMNLITSWMQANPPFRGVNWSSGIELALRLVSIGIFVASVEQHLTQEDKRLLCSFVASHAHWLQRNPSLYSSANNHRVAEGLGLLLACQLVPELPGASQIYTDSISILENAVRTQFFADGIGVEQSPSYSAFTLEMLAFAALMLKGVPEAKHLNPSSLVQPAMALRSFLNHKGVAPNIGDNDETRVIAGPLGREPRYIASVLAAVAGLSERPELAPPARDAHLRDLVFAGAGVCPLQETQLVTFAHGGYSTYHGTFSKRRVHLVFDHGPLGFGSIAAHGHADALAFWLSIDGDAVLADSGTYLYYSGGPLRDLFRSTASHSTLQVGSRSQSDTAGAFNWRRKAEGRVVRIASSPWSWEIEGEHEGYKQVFGVKHNRRIICEGDTFLIIDRLFGVFDRVDANLNFILDPSVVPEQEGNCNVLLKRGGHLLGRVVFSGSSLNSQSLGVSNVPFSPHFNELLSTSRLSVSAEIGPGETISTRIELFPGMEGSERRIVQSGS